ERVLCESVISVAPGKFEDMRSEEVQDHLLADRGDPGQTGLPEQTGNRILLRVAHATVWLQRAICRVEARVRAQVFGHVRLLAARLPVIIKPSGLAEDELRGLEARQGVGKGKLNSLILADLSVEHDSVVAVLDGRFERGIADAQSFRGDED